jgi:beta-glucanase (GH16 family)
LSDDLDEIDVEFLGGKPQNVSTNYFGKGILDYQNADLFPVNGGVQADYHNYTTVWTQDALTWYIDGVKVRTLLPKDANNTKTYPQTPMRFSLGAWAGGDSGNEKGVIDWAGGVTDYSKGPYTMYVRSAHITDYSTNSSSYTYGDTSGTYQSIRVEK